jgi:hypothetical protein
MIDAFTGTAGALSASDDDRVVAAGVVSVNAALKASNFGFTLAADAVITGFTAVIERSGTGGTVKDAVVVLEDASATQSNDKAVLTETRATEVQRTFGVAQPCRGTHRRLTTQASDS